MGKLVGLIGGVVGLAAEAATHQANKSGSRNLGSRESHGDGNVNDQYSQSMIALTLFKITANSLGRLDASSSPASSQWSARTAQPDYERDEQGYIPGPNPRPRLSYLQPPEQTRSLRRDEYSKEKFTVSDPDNAADEYWMNQNPPTYEENFRQYPTTSQGSYGPSPSREAMSPNIFASQYSGTGPLTLPIIIPQRRPENKSRGWAYVYAPCLASCGIEQEIFINFILGFNKACQASPALDAVNLAALGVGFAPGIAPMVISMAVPLAVSAAKNAQTTTQ